MQRIFAIGDIHGCYRPFDLLLKTINLTPDDILVTLGDYVDRGPDSRMVIERLIGLSKTHNVICLRGNHEQLMLDARNGREQMSYWTPVGGNETIASYGSFDKVPKSHWEFIEKKCVKYWECDTHFFVHANADSNKSLAKQSTDMLYWERFNGGSPHMSGKIMVCGHTAQTNGRILNLGYAICLDTFAYGGQWLSCLNIVTGEVYQANSFVTVRTSHIKDYLQKLEPDTLSRR